MRYRFNFVLGILIIVNMLTITNAHAQEDKAVTGKITVKAIQGTPGGPAIADREVEIRLISHGKLTFQTEVMLDEAGEAIVENLPIEEHGSQPLVIVPHAGVTYQNTGQLMDKSNPTQTMEIVCFEVTNDIPAWKINMRQVMLSHAPDGLKVTEILLIENPAENTWLGAPADAEQPITTSFNVPKGAKDFALGKGFHDWCCTTVENGKLSNHLPLMPDSTELNFSYIVPANSGKTAINLVAPVLVEQLAVIMPNDMELQPVSNLTYGGEQKISDTVVRYYTTANIQPDNTIHLVLAGLSSRVDRTGQPAIESVGTAKIFAVVGMGVILLFALVFLIVKSRMKGRIV